MPGPLGDRIDSMIDPILAAFDETIKKKIDGELVEVYLSGQAEMVDWGKTKGGIPISYEGPPMQAAIDWAEKHGAKLVTQMDEETKRRLANVISQGIENKRGVPGISRDLRQAFGDMAKYRSDMIARTETANALSQSSLDAMNDMGVEGKEWVWGGSDCDICKKNEAKGVIRVDDVFPSGHEAPPAHPNCTCAISPAFLKGKPARKAPAGEPEVKSFDAKTADEYVKQNYGDIKFAKGEKDVAGMYTRTIMFNDKVRSGDASIKAYSKQLDNAIGKCALKDNVKVYRGVGRNVFPDSNMAGKIFTDKGYVSTSLNKEIAKEFSRGKGSTVMEIVMPKGAKGLPMEVIGKGIRNEAEILLPRGSQFKIVSDKLVAGKRYLTAEVM